MVWSKSPGLGWSVVAGLVGLAVGWFSPVQGQVGIGETIPHTCNQENCFTIVTTNDPNCNGGSCVGGLVDNFPKCTPDPTNPPCQDNLGLPWVCNGACENSPNTMCSYTLYECQ